MTLSQPEPEVNVQVTLPKSMHKRLRQAALDNDATLAAFVKDAIAAALDRAAAESEAPHA